MKTKTPVTVLTVPDSHTPTRLLRPSAVAARIGLSIPTIWRLRRRGDFPAPIQLSVGAIAFREQDVERWIAARAARLERMPETV